jgi:hypothetical protein
MKEVRATANRISLQAEVAYGRRHKIYTDFLIQKPSTMKTVGHRRERPISPAASGALLAEGARFNDEIHRLPTGNMTFIPKGVYRFMTHAEANRHQEECLALGMARLARERANGR